MIEQDRPRPPKPLIDNKDPFKDDPLPPPLGLRVFKRPVSTVSHEEPAQNSKSKGCRNCISESLKDTSNELYSLDDEPLKTNSKGVAPASYRPSVRLAQPLKSTSIPKNPLR